MPTTPVHSPTAGKALIYRASAGSGKTFALVKAYLKLVLLDPARYPHVLAITFTNDATGEMKQRILHELARLAADEDTDMRKAILADFKAARVVNIAGVLTQRAGKVLQSLLHDYDRFYISTIDAFFAQLVRHLARELKLNLNFELDVDTGRALDEAVDMLFATATEEVLDWLERFVLHKLDEDKGWHIKRDIAGLGRMLFKEDYLEVAKTIARNSGKLATFIEELQSRIKRFENYLTPLGKEGMQIIEKAGLTPDDFKRGTFTIIRKLAAGTYDFTEKPSATFAKLTQPPDWHNKNSDKANLVQQAVRDGLGAIQQKIMTHYDKGYRDYLEARVIMQHIYSYGLLAVLAGKLRAYRESQNLVFVSDMVYILLKAINEKELPFIYEKIGARFQYILIDEFQDTSRYQWRTLLPFLRNALDEGGELMIVGDVKQSIYRWRGGEMELLLHQAANDLPAVDFVTLDTNYRSGRQIVAFNNAFFQVAPQVVAGWDNLSGFAADLLKAYADVEQKAHKQALEGYVEVRFLPLPEVLEAAYKTIKQTLKEGYRTGDILLLTRSNKEAAELARYLLDRDIKVISEQALQVQSSDKVQLIISALRYLHNQENLLAVGYFNFYYNRLFGTDRSLNEPLTRLDEQAALRQQPAYEVVEELIIHLKIPAPDDIYLQHLLDLCLSRAAKGEVSIADFLAWWEEETAHDNSRQLTVSLPDDADTARAMTVHKAKGLQARVVLVPYGGFDMKPKSDVKWVKPLPDPYKDWGTLPLTMKKDLLQTRFDGAYLKEYFANILESLNIIYVAFTRPVERLHVFVKDQTKAGSGKNKKYAENAAGLIQAVFEHPGFAYGGHYEAAAGRFALGTRQAPLRKDDGTPVIIENQRYAGSGLAARLAIDQEKEIDYLLWSAERQQRLRLGRLIHQSLALLPTLAELDAVLLRQQQAGILGVTEMEAVKEKILALFEAVSELHDWFGDRYEVLTERRLVADGRTYIPDRVMLHGQQAIVVDFKLAVAADKYREQVRNYGAQLARMGYEPVAMYLLFVDTQTLEQVL